jgi:hypothetical protein
MPSRQALMKIENSPNVRMISGNVKIRKIVPMNAFTRPKMADTQT